MLKSVFLSQLCAVVVSFVGPSLSCSPRRKCVKVIGKNRHSGAKTCKKKINASRTVALTSHR